MVLEVDPTAQVVWALNAAPVALSAQSHLHAASVLQQGAKACNSVQGCVTVLTFGACYHHALTENNASHT
jgi:hypothetical protein